MARSAQITVTKVHNHYYLALPPCDYARIYQPSSTEISGKVQKMPQTGNTSFSPGSLNRCGRGLDLERYVKGEKKFIGPAGVGYLIGDSSKRKRYLVGGRRLRSRRLWK